jgi:MarR family transcriptional regulator, organic hydroperoxide resistance regulator
MNDDNGRARELLEKILALQVAFRSNLARKARGMGLSVAQATVAQDLADHPGSALQEVCSRLDWPKSTVSRLVDDLVRLDLATRDIPPENRRTVLIALKPALMDECLASALTTFFPGSDGFIPSREAAELGSALDRLLLLMKP